MTRDERRGLDTLAGIGKYTPPQPCFIGADEKKLYRAEEKRNEAVRKCAEEWAAAVGVDKKEFWTRSIPQTLFDLLHNYETGAAIVASEAYLKQMGWTVLRPEPAKQEEAA